MTIQTILDDTSEIPQEIPQSAAAVMIEGGGEGGSEGGRGGVQGGRKEGGMQRHCTLTLRSALVSKETLVPTSEGGRQRRWALTIAAGERDTYRGQGHTHTCVGIGSGAPLRCACQAAPPRPLFGTLAAANSIVRPMSHARQSKLKF